MKARNRRAFFISSVVVCCCAGAAAAHFELLIARSRDLIATSARFPILYTAGNFKKPTIQLLVMGDSTAVGTGATDLQATCSFHVAASVEQRGFAVSVTNIGRVGATAADVRRDQSPLLKRAKPDIVLLMVGSNDATHFTRPDEFEREMTALLKEIKQSGARKAYITNTPNLAMTPALPGWLARVIAARAKKQNEILNKLAQGSPFIIVDLYHKGKLDPRVNPRDYAADDFHPSDDGYSVWNRVIDAAMKG